MKINPKTEHFRIVTTAVWVLIHVASVLEEITVRDEWCAAEEITMTNSQLQWIKLYTQGRTETSIGTTK